MGHADNAPIQWRPEQAGHSIAVVVGPPTMVPMWFSNNWPIILIALAVFIVGAGLMRKVAKMAFLGVAIGVIGLFLWPIVSESF